MLLSRIFRVALGSAQGSGVIRSDTFPEPPAGLPRAHRNKGFPRRGIGPSPPSRDPGPAPLLGLHRRNTSCAFSCVRTAATRDWGGSAESGTIPARSPRPNCDTPHCHRPLLKEAPTSVLGFLF